MKNSQEKNLTEDSIDQQVIDFTAVYVSMPSEDIHNSTTLESIGIISEQDLTQYLVELEESFALIYEPGDQIGIVTVGDAAKMIEKKLSNGETAFNS